MSGNRTRPFSGRCEMNLRTAILCATLVLMGWSRDAGSAAAQTATVDTSQAGRGLLRPGDVITLKVWREPEWSGDFAVNQDGVATLPRIGEVAVMRMSADSLRRFLVDTLGTFLRNPSIEVILQHRIRVLGAVRNPGVYPVPSTVTIADAVAVAGGATGEGQLDKVILRRDGQQLRIDLNKDTRLTDTPIRTGDELFVPQRGWVSRNTGLVAAGLSAVTTVVVALLLR